MYHLIPSRRLDLVIINILIRMDHLIPARRLNFVLLSILIKMDHLILSRRLDFELINILIQMDHPGQKTRLRANYHFDTYGSSNSLKISFYKTLLLKVSKPLIKSKHTHTHTTHTHTHTHTHKHIYICAYECFIY